MFDTTDPTAHFSQHHIYFKCIAEVNKSFILIHKFQIGTIMRKSKLENYIAILNTLEINGPMRSNKITCETNISYSYIKKALNDLRDKQLVEEKKIKNSVIYLATPKAKLALSQFREISENLPIFEEDIVL